MIARKVFNWRFVAMFVVMLLVSVAAYAFVRRVNQTDALVDTARQAVRTSARQADELAELRQINKHQAAQSTQRSKVASAERNQLSNQVTELQKQLAALTTFLRENNINVPSSVSTPRAGATRPKGRKPGKPRHVGPGTPPGTPTPTPSAGDPLCDLVPMACIPPLPLSTPLLPLPLEAP